MQAMTNTVANFLKADIHVYWSWLYYTTQNLKKIALVQSFGKIVEINAFSPNFDKKDRQFIMT